MRAGLLSERLIFKQRGATQNSLGEKTAAWVEAFTVWGGAEPVRGSAFFAMGQSQMRVDVKFRVRYRTDITNAMRVEWRGQDYELTAPPIDPKGRKVELELMCRTAQ